MEKGWKHKKTSNKNKFKVGDIVSYSDGVQKFEGKITGDFTDEKFYVGDKYGYQVSGFGDRLKPEQLTLVTKKIAKGGGVGKKVYNTMYGVGRSKYVVNYHDGVKTHKDGSEFFDIAIFKNKIEFNKFVNKLKKEGYVQGHKHGGKMEHGGGVAKTINKEKIGDEVYEFLKANGYQLESISEGASGEIIIEPSTRKTGDKRKDFFDGMQIIRFPDGTYEVSEYMAGPKEDEMYIYKETKSLKVALKDLIKGNNRKPIKKYAKGGGVKSSNNVFKLRAEGLNDFLAFLQEGMYFRVKSFTVETSSGPDVVVSFETDASLSEIKSKLDEVPDSHVMLETVMPINEYTGERNEEYAKGGGVYSSDTMYELKVFDGKSNEFLTSVRYRARSQREANEIGQDYEYEMQQKYGDYLRFVVSEAKPLMAKGGGVGTSSKLKYSLYLDRTVGDDVTTYHIADFAAKGDLSIALESLKEAAPKNYMYYTK